MLSASENSGSSEPVKREVDTARKRSDKDILKMMEGQSKNLVSSARATDDDMQC